MSLSRLAAVALLLGSGGCAAASIGASRYLATGGSDLTAYRVARESPLAGPFGYEMMAVFRPGGGGESGAMAGAGIDLTVLAGHPDSPYLIGGVEAGIGTRAQPGTWGSWSLGLGAQLLRAAGLGVRVEGRYRRLSADDRQGLEVGVRIGRGWRGSGSSAPAPPRNATIPRSTVATGAERGSASPGDAGSVRATVVGIATEAMGTPYRWGGSSADGFDCSGLIQFAYGEVGIALPRRSSEQAQAGAAVGRDVARLLPGDVLTFATGGGSEVTHVGLYLGDGRFIHSATGGVQVSVLSEGDPYGRWWWQRWQGARRIVP